MAENSHDDPWMHIKIDKQRRTGTAWPLSRRTPATSQRAVNRRFWVRGPTPFHGDR